MNVNQRSAARGALWVMSGYLAWLGAATPATLQAPPAILFVLAIALAAGALAVPAAGGSRPTRASHALAAVILFCFAGAGGWIAWSPAATGPCTIGITQGEVLDADSRRVSAAPGACRAAFGAGALMSAAIGGMASALWWRGRGDDRDGGRRRRSP